MTKAIENLVNAQKKAMSIRPKVGGFPVLAETLRQAGVTKNLWSLPSCQSIYVTHDGIVVQPGQPLIHVAAEIAKFNEKALIQALRQDQAGEISFPEFIRLSWEAGVIGYEVDFEKRTCRYFGALNEVYQEDYPSVELPTKI